MIHTETETVVYNGEYPYTIPNVKLCERDGKYYEMHYRFEKNMSLLDHEVEITEEEYVRRVDAIRGFW